MSGLLFHHINNYRIFYKKPSCPFGRLKHKLTTLGVSNNQEITAEVTELHGV